MSLLPALLSIAWAIGQVWRDKYWLTGLCFYAPSPVVAALLALGGLTAWWLKRRSLACYALLLACAPLTSVLLFEHRWFATDHTAATLVESRASLTSKERGLVAPQVIGSRTLRVVHWNVMWGKRGWSREVDELLPLQAELYALSEIDPSADYSRFEGYSVLGDMAMVIVARGTLTGQQRRLNKSDIRTWVVDWSPPSWPEGEPPVRVMMVDLTAMLQFHRDPPLALLRREIAELRPDLVLGDFNAPRQSRRLAPLPAGYRHAYDVLGAGWSATWPWPLPVLAIDQLITGQRLTPLRYAIQSSGLSDHRRQFLEVTLGAESGL
ncbi:endonuclease/exonuclease/phosphatase family protein [Botrimarina hoheduenensis]|uniref:endonuclease/exonuclease/phosphatase family protein n=1 Tax=Botrimarina hoheduenensis TaxID=2528000 RepID=UPI0011B3F2E5|nr:endonuclease/exonuclease/phosphatase family protein [Botrimarina hoheduenensis]